ncbi:MAG: drug/metabolite transporter (DMT)-like permease [Gammaproteobacteria bacterium]
MTPFALALVLAAAFCHATWNFFVKRINGGPELIWLFSTISAVIYLPVAVYMFFSAGQHLGAADLLVILASAVLHLGYFLLLQQGYRKGDLSLVYPTARATGPFLSTGFAIAFLGEQITPQMFAGALAVIVGVLFLTGGFKRDAKRLTSSLLFGLGAGTLIGSYTVWDAYAVSALMIPPILLDYASSVGRAILLAPYAMKRTALMAQQWREHRVGVICIAIFNPLAYVLVLYALTFTPVVYVAPTRELSVLITVLMGTLLLGEGQLRQRLTWASVILIGVVLLASG